MTIGRTAIITLLGLRLVSNAAISAEFSPLQKIQMRYVFSKAIEECLARRLREYGVALDDEELQVMDANARSFAGISSDAEMKRVLEDGVVERSIRNTLALDNNGWCRRVQKNVDPLVRQILDAKSPPSRP
jgi:hypothetical protein